jgi:hypothetical protein
MFGPGGRQDLGLEMGGNHLALPAGPSAFGYTWIVYTLNPFPFTIRPNARTALMADVGAVPEPASLVLFSTALIASGLARRRQRRTRSEATDCADLTERM